MPQADSKKSSGQEQQQTAQTVSYPSHYPQQFEDDTIDLFELWIILWKRKWLVIAVTVVAALGSIVYALVTPSVYKAEALLLPPKAKDIQSMNILGLQDALLSIEKKDRNKFGDEITSAKIFKKFKQNLTSRNLHKKFIHENGLMELLAPDRTPEIRNEEIYKGFAEIINLEDGPSDLEDVKGITTLSIEMHDADIASQWVNDLIKFVNKETIAMLVQDLQNSIANQIVNIEYKIGSKRQMAKLRREDQIDRYLEAAKIAVDLGIKRRVDATNIIQSIQPVTQMNVDIATASTPLYYLGHEALLKEISILKNRESDDPFIAGLRDYQEQLALLRSIRFNKEKLNAVHIDQAAYPPTYATKPNRRLIVSIGTVVGLFSGIFLAFFIEFFQNQRKKHSE